MSIESIEKFLIEVTSMIREFNKKLDNDGSRFNIFSILNLSSSEVRLHSVFLSELFNINGTHSCGNDFFKLFLKEISHFDKNCIIANFNTNKYTVEVEKYVGKISTDYSSGGRLDILIKDNFNRKIIIENKIFAIDQENQLLRYHNYDKNALLLYLTLDGSNPSNFSTGRQILIDVDFICISYKHLITKWLKKCLEIIVSKNQVVYTIKQYINIIEIYTQQSYKYQMSENIISLLSSNKDLFTSIDEIISSYNIMRNRIYENFLLMINDKKPTEIIHKFKDGIELKYLIAEDNVGFFYGFFLELNNCRINSTDERYSYITNLLREINPEFQKNETYIGWIFSSHFRKFFSQNNEIIFELNSILEMENFTNSIILEITAYIDFLKDKLA